MAPRAESGYITVNGGRLYFEVTGHGHPLVLIHAGVADHRMWDEQFAVFAQRYRVIRYDTRGFGRSKTEDVEFANHRDLHDVLEHLGIQKAYLLGASRAGGISIDFTLEYPAKVDALILMGSGLGGLDHQPTDSEQRMFDEMEELWNRKEFAALADLEVRVWVDGPGQPATRVNSALRQRVREMILNTYNTHTAEGRPQRLDPPAAKRLGEIRVPTLIIVGDLDESGVLAAGDVLARDVPGARKVVMTGTAHLPSMERPEEFNRIILDFLAHLPPRGSSATSHGGVSREAEA
jgi:pimeloyl-ACP methyl ester carboxylesterase